MIMGKRSMKAACKALPLFLALALVAGAARAGTVGGDSPRADRAGVGGRVLGEASPLAAAGVYAYQLADLSVRKVLTDNKGGFLFQELPAGLYKIIAHKPGFVPVVVMLTRTAARNYQFVELQLTERPVGKTNGSEDDFWSVRSRIPGDVLRDIEGDEVAEEAHRVQLYPMGSGQRINLAQTGFRTEMQAMTGVDQIAALGGGQVSGAGVGIKGTVGEMQVGVRGSFWQLSGDPMSAGGPGTGGQASTLSLDLSHGDSSRLTVSSLSNRFAGSGRGEGREMEPVDFEHYKLNWTQDVGENGRSEVSAQYTAENNYHRQGPIDPLGIPEASQTFWLEGAYTTSLGDRNMLQTGLRYRERQFGLNAASLRQDVLPVSQSIDAFSRGGVRVRPAVLLEYGLYSTLSDGSLSLMPQGGIVLQLGSNWQVQGNASRRVYEDKRLELDFLPSLFEESDLCEQGSSTCYQVGLSRQLGEDESLSLSATHREIGETLRLYFSNELFDRSESLYLVRGDALPEMRLELTKKLGQHVLTRLESSLASGGGGTFVAADRRSYENQIRYMVTSLDTQFLSSQTGVFVAFHQLSQELQPSDGKGPSAEVGGERLRLQLTQDLGFLMDLAADWAVQLNMELSRGSMSSDSALHQDELRRRLMGGIAVKF